MYANDFCSSSFFNDSALLYADETTLYKPICCSSDLLDFQKDIVTIHNWFKSNHLTAHASKTKAMIISTKKDPYSQLQRFMNNQLIERVCSVKFLGIWISANLTWNVQVDHICKKARKIIGFLHRSFQNARLSIRRSLYITLVRPILDYGSITYQPLNQTLTNRIESTQRFALRVILQSWSLSHDELLSKADLPLLSKRRDFDTLCHLYKILLVCNSGDIKEMICEEKPLLAISSYVCLI